ncbi:ATP-binding protein [Nonomuraea angiospora]|uniref:sensor histidine kinase n=1 Tax=Nonomuraea angiospora TaxID=46172 RepID=UPI00344B465B
MLLRSPDGLPPCPTARLPVRPPNRHPVGVITSVSTTERIEHSLMRATTLMRLCSLFMLLVDILTSSAGDPALRPLSCLVGVAVCQTVVFLAICRRRRALMWQAVLVDVLVISATQWPGGLLLSTAGHQVISPTFNYVVMAAPVAGLAPWPLPAALLAAALMVAATAANRAVVPLSIGTMPDLVSIVAAVVIAWVVAVSAREVAARVDERRRRAVARAGVLARRREQGLVAEALRHQLMTTMERLADDDQIATPYVREHVRLETSWLRRLITTGATLDPGSLIGGLAYLVAEKIGSGLTVHTRWPDHEPLLSPGQTEALVGATREALTNVTKHAAVSEAWLVVRAEADMVVVEISDEGQGFDVTSVTFGVGGRESIRRRLADAGGEAVIESAPGRGTRVRLSVRRRR